MTKTISKRQLEIIKAAGKILTAAGVSGLTIKNLAREMKFAESAIYRHFDSKEEIIIAMLEYLAQNIDERYSKAITKKLAPEEKFTLLLQNQFIFFKANPHFVVAAFSDGLLEESQRINETIHKIMGIKMKHLLPVIKEGQLNKLFTTAISAEDLVHIIMGAFRLQMFKWRVANFEFDIKRSGDKMIQTILTLIKD